MALIIAALFWTPTWSDSPREHLPWKTGFWVWAGDAPAEATVKPDLLYVQVTGTRWPEGIPEASNYIVVRRLERETDITPQMAAALAAVYTGILENGPRSILGLQIDYDCPTSRLSDYASFLTALHRALPPETHLSITALLDWFRPDTRIREVVRVVDEFVPQFYDAGSLRQASGIAEKIDVDKWAPIFNDLGVPYRIGISSFGRVARKRANAKGAEQVMYFRDVRPLDFASRTGLQSSIRTTAAGEAVVQYAVPPQAHALHSELAGGDSVAITFPTTRSVLESYEAVRRFGGYCAGAIFFRWPNRNETLAFTADEVSEIRSGKYQRAAAEVETREGSCVSLHCTDVHLRLPLHPVTEAQNILIRPSGRVEMFLPDGPLQARWRPSGDIAISIPAYSGLRSVYLGRALSHDPIQFEVVLP
jgi:hypothetical protein